MEGVGHQGPQRLVIVDPMRNLPKFCGEKIDSADNHLDAFDDYLEYNSSNNNLTQYVILEKNRWLVGEISNGMVMKLLMNFHTQSPN